MVTLFLGGAPPLPAHPGAEEARRWLLFFPLSRASCSCLVWRGRITALFWSAWSPFRGRQRRLPRGPDRHGRHPLPPPFCACARCRMRLRAVPRKRRGGARAVRSGRPCSGSRSRPLPPPQRPAPAPGGPRARWRVCVSRERGTGPARGSPGRRPPGAARAAGGAPLPRLPRPVGGRGRRGARPRAAPAAGAQTRAVVTPAASWPQADAVQRAGADGAAGEMAVGGAAALRPSLSLLIVSKYSLRLHLPLFYDSWV